MVLQPKYEDASYFLTVNPIAEIFKELNIAPSAVINGAWYCMVLHSIAWYFMVLHDIAWY